MIRKFVMLLGLVFAVSASPVLAANIENLSGQSCGASEGEWHFIQNNIPAGVGLGTLNAEFSGEPQFCQDLGNYPGKGNNKSMQHFYCLGHSGTLVAASTNIPGNLRFSHVSCEDTKCDPKTQACEPPK